jgi:lipoprotein Spr
MNMQVREGHRRSIIGKLVTFAKFLFVHLRTYFLVYKFWAIAIVLLLSSCSVLSTFTKPTRSAHSGRTAISSPAFLPAIAVDKPAGSGDRTARNNKMTSTSATTPTTPVLSKSVPIQSIPVQFSLSPIEAASSLQLKYAVLLDTEVESLPASELLEQIDPWMGVPYRSGGTSKTGVDCSAFTMQVLDQCCGRKLPRTSKQQYAVCEPADLSTLLSGDLLFFATRGKTVSHVGIYLGNGKFAHASVSSGVTVSDMSDPYYQKRFISAGRIPVASAQ